MKVDVALLCDAASVREGLLFVLGGGITRIVRPEFPAPLGLDLAVRLVIHPTEAGTQHSLTVFVQDEDGARHTEITASFAAEQSLGAMPGEEIHLPLPLNLRAVGLPAPGSYAVEILIDNVHQVSVPFVAHASSL